MSWKVYNRYWSNLRQWCTVGLGWSCHIWGHKVKVQWFTYDGNSTSWSEAHSTWRYTIELSFLLCKEFCICSLLKLRYCISHKAVLHQRGSNLGSAEPSSSLIGDLNRVSCIALNQHEPEFKTNFDLNGSGATQIMAEPRSKSTLNWDQVWTLLSDYFVKVETNKTTNKAENICG